MSDRTMNIISLVLAIVIFVLCLLLVVNLQDTAYSAGQADALCSNLGGEIIKGENNSIFSRHDWKATCVNLNTNEAWLLEATDD